MEILIGIGAFVVAIGIIALFVSIDMGQSPTKDPHCRGGHDF